MGEEISSLTAAELGKFLGLQFFLPKAVAKNTNMLHNVTKTNAVGVKPEYWLPSGTFDLGLAVAELSTRGCQKLRRVLSVR